MPFPGKSHRVEEHHAEHLVDLDKEGFHAFVKYLVRRSDIDEGGSRIRAVFDFCVVKRGLPAVQVPDRDIVPS